MDSKSGKVIPERTLNDEESSDSDCSSDDDSNKSKKKPVAPVDVVELCNDLCDGFRFTVNYGYLIF